MTIFDTVQLPSREGYDLRAEAWYDEDITELEDGSGSEEVREAFYANEWGYCGVVIVASRSGIDLGRSSIWGCEYGSIPGVQRWVDPLGLERTDDESTLQIHREDLTVEALEMARDTLVRIGVAI